MRFNNLARCIFKTKVPNECLNDNNATIYKGIREIKEKKISSQRINNA